MTHDTPTLASFENWQINCLTPQQKSDAVRQFTENGFPPDQVEKVFGLRDFNLTPSDAMIARKQQSENLRQHFTGDRAVLEAELAKAGL